MRLLAPLIVLFLGTCVRAQNLTGHIVDANTGAPLSFASIYVENTKSGSASNADGYFQVRLAPGSNRVTFSYLGYSSKTETVSGATDLRVELSAEALDLRQIEVLSSGEDLSYSVIRRAIAKADYHLQQLDAYTAEVYIKGTGKINKIPGLIKLLTSKEDYEEIDERLGQPFTSESTSRVTYTRPNTYKQEVISAYSVGDNQFNANPYIFTSFYRPYVAEQMVGPLHPRAFGYYRFVHEGVFTDQGELINRIKVIPRSKGEDVFEGYINIVQDDWSLHSLDLTTYKLGFEISIKRTFAEVQDRIWMPITTTMDADGQLYGFALEYHYLSTISRYELSLNDELGGYVEVIDEKTQPEAATAAEEGKARGEMENVLAEGGELTRKDMRRLMKEYRKQERKESEAPEVVRNSTFISDSATVITDSAAWAALRPVPLTALERRGYARIDSLQRLETDEPRAKVSVNLGSGSGTEEDEAAVERDDNGQARRWKTTVLPEPIFSPVEGYAPGADLTVHRRTKTPLTVNLRGRYGLDWKRFIYRGALAGGKSGIRELDGADPLWVIGGGRFLRQFDRSVPINPWLNVFTTLLGGNNFINYYERSFGQLAINKQFGDRWTARFRTGYEDRSAVVNNSNRNLFGLDDEETYNANAPVNAVLNGRVLTVRPALTAQIGVEWRPGLQFTVTNGKREVLNRSAPMIGLEIEQGIEGIGSSEADFTRVQGAYRHYFRVGRRGDVDLLIRGGSFLNNDYVDFPDFRHFATTEIALTDSDPIVNYRLLNYYQESTNEEYLEVHGHYGFRKLLLTQIYPLHLKGLKENLFVSYLYTPTSDNYTELGYSLDNILRILRIEFVTSFRDYSYQDFGVRVSVSSGLEELLR